MDKIQVIKHKCCGAIFSACQEPECYTDKDYLKELRKYVEAGDTVDMVNRGEWEFGECVCVAEGKKFILPDPNQTDLFKTQN